MLKMLFCIKILLQKVAAFWLPFEITMDTQKPYKAKILRVVTVQTFS